MGNVIFIPRKKLAAPLLTIERTAIATQQNSSAATVTFNNVNIGSADSSREVIVVVSMAGAGFLTSTTSVSIGGSVATIHADTEAANGAACVIASRSVPTGTSANIVVTFSETLGGADCVAVVYKMTGHQSSTPFHANSTSDNTAFTRTTTLNIPPNGFALAGVGAGQDAGLSWTGLDQDTYATIDSLTYTTAYNTSMAEETGRTVQVDGSFPWDGDLVCASWA